MNKIKQQFTDLRKNTPRHVQWLLLAAAFIVVLILLTLMIGGNKKDANTPGTDMPIELLFTPSTDSIDWGDTIVGDTRSQTIKISATAPAKVLAVRRTTDIPGLSDPQQTCTNIGEIAPKKSCTIVLEYKPTSVATARSATLFIDWRAADAPDEMKKTDKITLVLGANGADITPPTPQKEETPTPEPAPQPAPMPAPIILPEPEPTPIPKPEPMVIPEPTPVKQEIIKSVTEIAPSDPFADAAPAKSVVTRDNTPVPSESCSEFAIAGYNNSGTQIGWIKPSGGAYYFYPFSDRDCKNPTGVYNQDNGIITDIKNRGKKIGTDAEHIGYAMIAAGTLPQLSDPTATRTINKARQFSADELPTRTGGMSVNGNRIQGLTLTEQVEDKDYLSSDPNVLVNSIAHDRTFVLRQYKPIPATIVSEIRADVEALKTGVPVRATVDRNVYADNGRTIIIPTGTLMMGYVTGNLPGPYTAVGRMEIQWYQFVLPNGVEFNFPQGSDPFSGDAQGRVGVPGRGSTDYMEQFFMPMVTAIVPAAVNMIAPIADTFVNQIDLDNNTVVQSGTVRSSELAKNEIITAWNQVASKLLVDMMDNTVPPFSIAAGTRITVYSPVDLMVTCGAPGSSNKKCAIEEYNPDPRRVQSPLHNAKPDYEDGSWTGQARSFNLQQYCAQDNNGQWDIAKGAEADIATAGYDYRTVLMYCQSLNYKAINNARQEVLYESQQQQFQDKYDTNNQGTGAGNQSYAQEVLGMTYDDAGYVENPFENTPAAEEPIAEVLTCEDGTPPDANGCCTGEIYTDMGEMGFNCCPESGGDCFPPLL